MAARNITFSIQFVVIALATMVAFAAIAQDDDCDRDSQTFSLKIKVKNDRPTAVVKGFLNRNADDLHVCRGDTIEWKLSGKKFFLEFPQGSPFDTDQQMSRNGKITTTVSPDAKRGVSYKYDIGIEGGGILDPIIIVD